jgi:arginase
MQAVMSEALAEITRRGGHLHVSFDIDFLDPSVAPGVGLTEPDGPLFHEAAAAMDMIAATGMLGSFDLVELAPKNDPAGDTARRVIELVSRAFARGSLSQAAE